MWLGHRFGAFVSTALRELESKAPGQKNSFGSLVAMLRRIHGWDLNGGAVRVAVFSLYVALLEEVEPPDLRVLVKNKKILPELWGDTLVHRDFFDNSDPRHLSST